MPPYGSFLEFQFPTVKSALLSLTILYSRLIRSWVTGGATIELEQALAQGNGLRGQLKNLGL